MIAVKLIISWTLPWVDSIFSRVLHNRYNDDERLNAMTIESSSILQWFIAALGGIISVLTGMAIWNNRIRFKTLSDRVTKVEDRINTEFPKAIAELTTEMAEVRGSIGGVDSKVDIISTNVTQRMDRYEANLPILIKMAVSEATQWQAKPLNVMMPPQVAAMSDNNNN